MHACMWHVCHLFFIYSLTSGHRGQFHILAIGRDAAVNMGVLVSLRQNVFNGFKLTQE
jgi:hypothetical protein